MKRLTSIIVGLAALLTLAPIGGGATHCRPDIIVHTFVLDFIPGPFFLGCQIDPGGHDADYRVLTPGASTLVVQFFKDLGASTPTLLTTLNGVGFEDEETTLRRQNDGAGWYYTSPTIAFPTASRSGILEILIFTDPEFPEYACWRTLEAACPDFP